MTSPKDNYPLSQGPMRSYDPVRLYSPTEYALLEGLERNYELQDNIPIDGAREDLRAYSPFKISVVPPLVYENVPEQSKYNLEASISEVVQTAQQYLSGILDFINFGEEEVQELLIPESPPAPGAPTVPSSYIDIILAAAEEEWNKNIKEPDCRCPGGQKYPEGSNCAPEGSPEIEKYMRSEQGAGNTKKPPYMCNGYKDIDETTIGNSSEWCGYFLTYVFGAAGLGRKAKSNLLSTRSARGWAQEEGGRRWVDPPYLQPGDIACVGKIGEDWDCKSIGWSGPPDNSEHFVLVIENNYPDHIKQISGNTFGTFPNGKQGNGVAKNESPFCPIPDNPKKKVVLFGVRPVPEDYEGGFPPTPPPDLANENQVALGVEGEIDRINGEIGGDSYTQSRRLGYSRFPFNQKDLRTIEAASHHYDSWYEAKQARTRGLLKNLGSGDSWGLERDKVERFISLGKERLATGNAQPVLADQLVAADIALQLDAILKTPPLTLLVNPISLNITYEKVQQYTNNTRFGFVYESWGEQQPKLSISGQTGAFIAGAGNTNLSGRETTSPSGVQFACKRDSAAFQNLMNLFTVYKNNGYIFDTLFGSKSPHFIGALSIEYDGWVYIGHMENFNYGFEEKESQNGRVQFDFEFTVSQMYDMNQPVDSVRPMADPNRGFLMETGRGDPVEEVSSENYGADSGTGPSPDVGDPEDYGGMTDVSPNSLGIQRDPPPEEEDTSVVIDDSTFLEGLSAFGQVTLSSLFGAQEEAKAYETSPEETQNVTLYDQS